jgi:hypothetical protein
MGNPLSGRDLFGLRDYDECETRAVLFMVVKNLYPSKTRLGNYLFDNIPNVKTARALAGHGGLGGSIFDFKIMEEYEGEPMHFRVNGRIYGAAEFGNFSAGYAGVMYGLGGYSGVRVGGVVWDAIDGDKWDWDADSVADIDAGCGDGAKRIEGRKA